LDALHRHDVVDLFRSEGALLFRGFSADTAAFTRFSGLCCTEFSTYKGGGFRWGYLNREAVGNLDTLMTTTGSTQGFALPLHGEMYYMLRRPSVIWFFCDRPPAAAGQTTVCDGRAIWEHLSPATRRFFDSHRIKYRRSLPDGEWQTTFQTQDPAEASEICRHNGGSFLHGPDGSITTEYLCSAVVGREDDAGGQVFINNLLIVYVIEWAFKSGWVASNVAGLPRDEAPMVVRMEDDSEIPDDVITEALQVADQLTVEVTWQAGDVLMIDNTRILHGRRAYDGRERAIYVRMGEPCLD
jgi:alpha-ketoglutarate-dependent taurine dioxygenase